MSAADLTLAELDAFDSRESLVDELTRRAAQSCGIDVPSWSWTTGRRGRASNARHAFTLPTWVGPGGGAWWKGHATALYLAVYVVHEVAHLPSDSYGHGPTFKAYERAALAELGIGIRYMRHYPAVLFDLETRAELYVSSQEVTRRQRKVLMAERRERALELLAAGQEPDQIGWVRGRGRMLGRFNGEWLPMPRDEEVVARRSR